MLNRLHITLLLATAVAIWAVVLIVRGVPITPDLLIPYGVAVSAITLLCVGFNNWCWRLFFFKGWLVQRPWVQGTWRAELQSSHVDPAVGQQLPPIICFMTIRQTFSSLVLRLHTSESSSVSISATILREEDGEYRLAATYRNEPSATLRGVRSEIHYGALMLAIHGDVPDALTGHYWTDRKTTGTLELMQRRDKLAPSYQAATTLFEQQ